MISSPRLRSLLRLALPAALLLPRLAAAQPVAVPDAAEIALGLEKLRVVGSALYVAAHPDDENTALLAYLSRGRLVRTAYLAMTRGDGGQNLIGDEKGDLMGLLRTQELLAARRIDGAQQFFTRAIDFGYSKSPEEALAIWGQEQVLADAVWVIRSFQPDVIVTRFPVTGEGGHGHHTASARLAEEAFAAAADPQRFPEQLARGVRPWQAKRLLWNVFRFRSETPRNPQPGWVSLDLGAYNALLGKSYTEIAALSRSMHKSQGFGSAERRGSWLNDFQPRLGEPPTNDLFDGVDLTWNRIPGGEAVAALVGKANREFRPDDPAAVVPVLVEAYAAMGRLGDDPGNPNDPNGPLVAAKRAETLELIRACAGLWLEAIATDPSATPGDEVVVNALALNRSRLPLTLESIAATLPAGAPAAPAALADNEPAKAELHLRLPADFPVSSPYWLAEPHGDGLFTLDEPALLGRPESPPALSVRFTLRSGDEQLVYEAPVLYRWTDPVRGEQYRRFEVSPPMTLDLDEKVYLFPGDGRTATPRPLRVTARAARANVSGVVRLRLDDGWRVTPPSRAFSLRDKGDSAELQFTVTPPSAPTIGTATAVAEVDGREIDRGVARLDYPHIPPQTVFPPASARLARLELASRRHRVGYIVGSGDEVPDTLRQLGYTVTPLSDDDLSSGDLSRFETIVAGVRAYNTRPRLRQAYGRLMEYVRAGGTLVAQYSTTADLISDRIGPYPFKLSHDRVTDETAAVTFVNPAHPLLHTPNRIRKEDFAGWVQERGLYFASQREGEHWDPAYQTVLASHDPNESDKSGGLLYARFGKGVFVYTGYSFFRQLPAGVPGAVRLFVNLVSASGADSPAQR